jgi:hypothetical protein
MPRGIASVLASVDAESTAQVDYAGNLAAMRSSYVVADTSPLRRSSDADRTGTVIGIACIRKAGLEDSAAVAPEDGK